MQNEINNIVTLISETANGNNWTGINTLQVLQDINSEKATKRVNSSHLNIAELTAHLTCWNNVMIKRLDAENYQPKRDEDFPAINDLSEDEWNTMKEDFIQSFKLLTDILDTKEDTILYAPMFEGATSAYRNLHGQISHLHYHLGQIVLLKKIL
ncbi:MAG TPA: DinB family protein [Chitinophagales bacterium]|nr:DinB family protein [Chitinophagales bacterium]